MKSVNKLLICGLDVYLLDEIISFTKVTNKFALHFMAFETINKKISKALNELINSD